MSGGHCINHFLNCLYKRTPDPLGPQTKFYPWFSIGSLLLGVPIWWTAFLLSGLSCLVGVPNCWNGEALDWDQAMLEGRATVQGKDQSKTSFNFGVRLCQHQDFNLHDSNVESADLSWASSMLEVLGTPPPHRAQISISNPWKCVRIRENQCMRIKKIFEHLWNTMNVIRGQEANLESSKGFSKGSRS